MARARAGKGVRGHRKGNKKKKEGARKERKKEESNTKKGRKKETNKQTNAGRKKERRRERGKKNSCVEYSKRNKLGTTGRVLGGSQGLFQMEIHIISSSYGDVLLFPDFAIFAVPRVRQTKGKRHLNFQTVLYPPINVAMKIDPPSMTNYNHRCIRKRATRMGFTTPYRARIDDASSILLRDPPGDVERFN